MNIKNKKKKKLVDGSASVKWHSHCLGSNSNWITDILAYTSQFISEPLAESTNQLKKENTFISAIKCKNKMFTKQPTVDMDIEFDIKLLATEYYEGTVGIFSHQIKISINNFIAISVYHIFRLETIVTLRHSSK